MLISTFDLIGGCLVLSLSKWKCRLKNCISLRMNEWNDSIKLCLPARSQKSNNQEFIEPQRAYAKMEISKRKYTDISLFSSSRIQRSDICTLDHSVWPSSCHAERWEAYQFPLPSDRTKEHGDQRWRENAEESETESLEIRMHSLFLSESPSWPTKRTSIDYLWFTDTYL